MQNSDFNDQRIFTDVLSTQKFITDGYNTFANEASEPCVKNTLMTILDEEHVIGHEVFEEMHKRGWYQTETAPQDKIQATKQKFAATCQSCQG